MIKSFADSRMITRCSRNKEAVLANLMCYSPTLPGGQQAAGPLPLAQEHFQAGPKAWSILVTVLVQTPPSLCVISVPPAPFVPLQCLVSYPNRDPFITDTDCISGCLLTISLVSLELLPDLSVGGGLTPGFSQGRWGHLRHRTEHPGSGGPTSLTVPS